MTIPASTCFYCGRDGIVSDDQKNVGGPLRIRPCVRFFCTCRHEWVVDLADAQLHGRFLDRAGLR